MSRQLDDRQFREHYTEFGDDIGKHWRVMYTVQRDETGDLVIASVKIAKRGTNLRAAFTAPQGGVTRKVMESVRIGLNLRWARQVIASQQLVSPARAARKGPGAPPTLTSRDYRDLLRRYEALTRAKHPAPAKALAEELGLSRTCVRSRLLRAQTLASGVT